MRVLALSEIQVINGGEMNNPSMGFDIAILTGIGYAVLTIGLAKACGLTLLGAGIVTGVAGGSILAAGLWLNQYPEYQAVIADAFTNY